MKRNKYYIKWRKKTIEKTSLTSHSDKTFEKILNEAYDFGYKTCWYKMTRMEIAPLVVSQY